ncbi:hypothetical protein BDBG_03563 [Blastomyces gilchristii SLH14081]|uniref:Uncharacterized protein n=1 Tax=Blastomyces gilchristii (strain SLH14081) TaxID=559298 RepID=A0A179UJW7_BLAGS|nr:uncharacterized protein BDBG_03563 [Blastomyces gilchristii SLH14081]OAT07509.1 hypothetical protein BDBG_03563 [Blastomyces gilchristii SLH14081]
MYGHAIIALRATAPWQASIPTKPRTSETTERLIQNIICVNASSQTFSQKTPTASLHYAAQSGKKGVNYGDIMFIPPSTVGAQHTRSRLNDVIEGLLIADRAEDALIVT